MASFTFRISSINLLPCLFQVLDSKQTKSQENQDLKAAKQAKKIDSKTKSDPKVINPSIDNKENPIGKPTQTSPSNPQPSNPSNVDEQKEQIEQSAEGQTEIVDGQKEDGNRHTEEGDRQNEEENRQNEEEESEEEEEEEGGLIVKRRSVLQCDIKDGRYTCYKCHFSTYNGKAFKVSWLKMKVTYFEDFLYY